MKTLKYFLISTLFCLPGLASGMMSVSGQFYGKTDTTVQILSRNQVFTIKKERLSKDQLKFLDSRKWKDQIDMAFPMDAIADVHDKK